MTSKLCAYDLIMTVIRLFTAANFEFNIIHFTSKAIRHFYLHANSKTSVLKLPTFNQYLLSFNHLTTTLWILLSCIKLNVVICLKNENTQRTRHLFCKITLLQRSTGLNIAWNCHHINGWETSNYFYCTLWSNYSNGECSSI